MSRSRNKIAILLPSLRCGGAERVAVTQANGLASKGIAVDLVLVKAELFLEMSVLMFA